MSNLLTQMKNSLAKSNANLSLFDHSLEAARIVDHMIKSTPDYPLGMASVLRLGAFLHDIGKLHPEFQSMLRGVNKSGRWVKHEAQTYRYAGEIASQMESLSAWLGEELQCEMQLTSDPDDILAFAVTHHGIYYSAFAGGIWQTKREWTKMDSQEERRITLADLLIRYYPLGGAVIFADMLASYRAAGGTGTEAIFAANDQQGWRQFLLDHRTNLMDTKEADRSARLSHDLLELLLV